MRKILLSILLCLALSTPAMAIVTYNCTVLTGGAQRAVDYISINDLNDGDRALVFTETDGMLYLKYYASGTSSEQTSYRPYVVRPDDYATRGIWVEEFFGSDSNDSIRLSKPSALSGTSYTFTAPLVVEAGTSLYSSSGSGTTLNFHGPVSAGLFAWMNSARNATGVTPVFHKGSVLEVYPVWLGENSTPGTTDMTDEINLAIEGAKDYIKNVRFTADDYLTTAPINMENVKGVKLIGTRAQPATSGTRLIGKHTGKAVLSMVGSIFSGLDGLEIYGDTASRPKVGLLLGRSSSASAGNHTFKDVAISGYYAICGYYNIASETNLWINPNIYPLAAPVAAAYYSQSDGLGIGGLTGSSMEKE